MVGVAFCSWRGGIAVFQRASSKLIKKQVGGIASNPIDYRYAREAIGKPKQLVDRAAARGVENYFQSLSYFSLTQAALDIKKIHI